MASGPVRVVLIFAGVAAVAAAGGYYFLAVYQPKQRLTAAQAGVAEWEKRYAAARECLLGPKPASSRVSEAIALRELNKDPWDRNTCTRLMGKLSRDAENSQIPAVERAWDQVDASATAAAKAFATHVVGGAPIGGDPLPPALDALDAAHAKLREAAKLPPIAETGKALPAAQVLPIEDAGEPLTDLTVDAIPSAHGLVVFGKTASHEVQATLVTGEAPRVGRVGPGAMRAVPDGSWGAVASGGEIKVGGFDAEGAIQNPTAVPLPGARTLTVAAVAGTRVAGIVVYGGDNMLAVAHARESGITADSPLRILTGVAGTDGDGRVALVWTTGDREHHGRILRPGGDDPVVELTETVAPGVPPSQAFTRPSMASTPCLTGDRAWIMFGPSLIGFGGPDKPVKLETKGHLIGCTADAALLRAVDPATQADTYEICAAECRAATLPDAPDDAAVTVVGGKLVAIAEHGGVLAVWREDAPVTYFGLPSPAHPVKANEWAAMALSDGKVIDVVARGAKSFAVIRIPAR